MAKWQVATAAALLLCAACATAQPFTLTAGASVTTNITTLTTSGQFVKVSTSALGQCLLLLLLFCWAVQSPALGDVAVLPTIGLGVHSNSIVMPAQGHCAACMQVSWSGIPAPTFGDVVGLYVQAPNTTVDNLAPLKFQWVNRSPGYQSGSGSITCVPLHSFLHPDSIKLCKQGQMTHLYSPEIRSTIGACISGAYEGPRNAQHPC